MYLMLVVLRLTVNYLKCVCVSCHQTRTSTLDNSVQDSMTMSFLNFHCQCFENVCFLQRLHLANTVCLRLGLE